ncbi:MAG: hypothetical protein ACJAT1_000400 [Marivirga sp.]|jgi:hypothetical protein
MSVYIRIVMKIINFVVLLCVLALNSFAQAPSKKLNNNPYKNSQWYFGFVGGFNYSLINVINDFNVIEAANPLESDLYQKTYQNKIELGTSYGLQTAYQFEQRLVLGGGVQLQQLRFTYNQDLLNSTDGIQFQHKHRISYIQVPVFFRFMIRQVNSSMWNTSWKKPGIPAIIPYVQAGLNFGFLMRANKDVSRSIINEQYTITDLSFSEEVSGLLNNFSFGAHIAVGARFRIGNVYLTAEANLNQTVTNLSNENTRYANENLVNNAYDVFDDMSATQLSALIGMVVPLKYLSTKEFLPIEL